MFMFEFDEGCFWIVTFGAKSATCDTSNTPRSLILPAVKAVIAIGVSCSDSSRRCAVTTTSSSPAARGASSCAVTGMAKPLAAETASARAEARTRRAW